MKTIVDNQEMKTAIQKMAREILEEKASLEKIVLVGITTRGVPLAHRIAAQLKKDKGVDVPVGTLDITLYRDDLSKLSDHPIVKQSNIPFSLDEKVVFLVDDVLYTGRTVRCALDALFDLGRPDAIGLIVMVDRGGRELPIQADIVGLHVQTKVGDVVHVRFSDTDEGEDRVDLEGRG